MTILTVRQLISFAFIKLPPHVYVDIYIQLLLLFSLCICTKACRLQILTVIILGHSSLIHVFLSYFLFKNQFCANRHTSIYSASSLIAELTWLVPGFQDFMGYVSRIGVYTLYSGCEISLQFFFFFGNNCLLICQLLAFQVRSVLEWKASWFNSYFALKRGATSPAPAPNLGPLLRCPVSTWVVSASALGLRPYSSVHSMKCGWWMWHRDSRNLLCGEKSQAGWWHIRKDEYCPLRLESES